MIVKNKNSDFYKYVEGNYNSYWLGKFINRFVKRGKRHVVEREFNKVYKFTKLNFKTTIITNFLQAVEKTRPTFMLKSRRIGAKTKEYPVFMSVFRQRSASIKNIKNICENRKEWYLNQRVLNELIDLAPARKNHLLIKERDEVLKKAAESRFNVRFSFRKGKRRKFIKKKRTSPFINREFIIKRKNPTNRYGKFN